MAERWNQPAEKLPDDHPAWSLEAEYLALGILSIVCIASPHRVIAGGGVMRHPHLIEAVRDRLRALNASYLDTPMLGQHIDDYLLPPKLGDNAGVLGALALAQLYD
jgi:fructokinase